MSSHESLVSTGKEVIREAPQLYIDLDVEADGVPGYGSLLSIGAVSPWGDTFYRELKPTSERFLPSNRAFAEAHGLKRERLLDEGVLPAVAAEELKNWTAELTEKYGKKRAVLAAFNASFDYPWVDLAMKEAGVEANPFGVAGFCIKSLAMALPGRYEWQKTAKGELPAELVPDGDFTHNALEDAQYQQKIHFALAGKLALMNGYEFSLRQNAHQLWEAAMDAANTATESTPCLLGHTILTLPEGAATPEKITLAHESDGNWSDTYEKLTITPDGPLGYEYTSVTWNPPMPEENVEEQYNAEAPETVQYLNRVAQMLRS